MKFLSFRARTRVNFKVNRDGTGEEVFAPRYGAVDGNFIYDLTARLKYPDLKSLIAADAVKDAQREIKGATADFRTDEVDFDPVIPNPGKIICIGLNYAEHANETGMKRSPHPPVFIRWADSQVGHLANIVKPNDSEQLDYEGELAVIVGKGGRFIPEAEAAKHIAGYSCYNEASVRDYQKHASQFTPGKNFPKTGAFGPFFVTADEVGELKGKKIQTRLNGQVVQSSTLDMMISSPARLIAYLSTFTPLSPGDVIASGTPGGVGWVRDPPLWMKVGDVAEVEIDGVGLLRNTIGAEE
jgi:2-keto-4-pentenoate hydratase/2-oxohepta-3-ene-1,7-dioic acid hydratase in catechol pathway